ASLMKIPIKKRSKRFITNYSQEYKSIENPKPRSSKKPSFEIIYKSFTDYIGRFHNKDMISVCHQDYIKHKGATRANMIRKKTSKFLNRTLDSSNRSTIYRNNFRKYDEPVLNGPIPEDSITLNKKMRDKSFDLFNQNTDTKSKKFNLNKLTTNNEFFKQYDVSKYKPRQPYLEYHSISNDIMNAPKQPPITSLNR
ncbi:MAG: hypothetical protein MHPSP_000653, partial [Paramarteilia canceri]